MQKLAQWRRWILLMSLIFLFIVYLCAMVLAPAISTGGDWIRVQAVWDRWQAFNVGVLALASSVTVFSISAYKENRQRKRSLQAANAFLPETLSEINAYVRNCMAELTNAYNSSTSRQPKANPARFPVEAPRMPTTKAPKAPSRYREVFIECIRHADVDLAGHLVDILATMQIQQARLDDLYTNTPTSEPLFRHALVHRMYDHGELMVLVNRLYPVARCLGPRQSGAFTVEEFNSAYLSARVVPESFKSMFDKSLLELTEEAVRSAKIPQYKFGP